MKALEIFSSRHLFRTCKKYNSSAVIVDLELVTHTHPISVCLRVEVTGLVVETRRLHEKAPHTNSRQTERRGDVRRGGKQKEMEGNKGKSGEDGGK